jgi:hypothetical protein
MDPMDQKLEIGSDVNSESESSDNNQAAAVAVAVCMHPITNNTIDSKINIDHLTRPDIVGPDASFETESSDSDYNQMVAVAVDVCMQPITTNTIDSKTNIDHLNSPDIVGPDASSETESSDSDSNQMVAAAVAVCMQPVVNTVESETKIDYIESPTNPNIVHAAENQIPDSKAWREVFHEQLVFLVCDDGNDLGFTSRFTLPGFQVCEAKGMGYGLFATSDHNKHFFHIYGKETLDNKSEDDYRYNPELGYYKTTNVGRPNTQAKLLTKWKDTENIPLYENVLGYGLGHFLSINEPPMGTVGYINSIFYKFKVVCDQVKCDQQVFIKYYDSEVKRQTYQPGDLTTPETLQTVPDNLNDQNLTTHLNIKQPRALHTFQQRRVSKLFKEQHIYQYNDWKAQHQVQVQPECEVVQAKYNIETKTVSYTLKNGRNGKCKSIYFPMPIITYNPSGRKKNAVWSGMKVWPGRRHGTSRFPKVYQGSNMNHYNFFPPPLSWLPPSRPLPYKPTEEELNNVRPPPCIKGSLCPQPSLVRIRQSSRIANQYRSKNVYTHNNVAVCESKGKGLGVFAVRGIDKDERLVDNIVTRVSLDDHDHITAINARGRADTYIASTKFWYDLQQNESPDQPLMSRTYFLNCAPYQDNGQEPNVCYFVDSKSDYMQWKVIKDIKRGEELLVTYNSGEMEGLLSFEEDEDDDDVECTFATLSTHEERIYALWSDGSLRLMDNIRTFYTWDQLTTGEVPGKGRGVLAKVNIPKGTILPMLGRTLSFHAYELIQQLASFEEKAKQVYDNIVSSSPFNGDEQKYREFLKLVVIYIADPRRTVDANIKTKIDKYGHDYSKWLDGQREAIISRRAKLDEVHQVPSVRKKRRRGTNSRRPAARELRVDPDEKRQQWHATKQAFNGVLNAFIVSIQKEYQEIATAIRQTIPSIWQDDWWTWLSDDDNHLDKGFARQCMYMHTSGNSDNPDDLQFNHVSFGGLGIGFLVNEDCDPNMVLHRNYMVAIRDISCGDSLLTSYGSECNYKRNYRLGRGSRSRNNSPPEYNILSFCPTQIDIKFKRLEKTINDRYEKKLKNGKVRRLLDDGGLYNYTGDHQPRWLININDDPNSESSHNIIARNGTVIDPLMFTSEQEEKKQNIGSLVFSFDRFTTNSKHANLFQLYDGRLLALHTLYMYQPLILFQPTPQHLLTEVIRLTDTGKLLSVDENAAFQQAHESACVGQNYTVMNVFAVPGNSVSTVIEPTDEVTHRYIWLDWQIKEEVADAKYDQPRGVTARVNIPQHTRIPIFGRKRLPTWKANAAYAGQQYFYDKLNQTTGIPDQYDHAGFPCLGLALTSQIIAQTDQETGASYNCVYDDSSDNGIKYLRVINELKAGKELIVRRHGPQTQLHQSTLTTQCNAIEIIDHLYQTHNEDDRLDILQRECPDHTATPVILRKLGECSERFIINSSVLQYNKDEPLLSGSIFRDTELDAVLRHHDNKHSNPHYSNIIPWTVLGEDGWFLIIRNIYIHHPVVIMKPVDAKKLVLKIIKPLD